MKKLIFTLSVFVLSIGAFAQAPQKMSYQAVVRNSSDALVINQSVGMQISILQGTTSGTEVYKERHFPNTNTNGLVSVEIGTGVVVSGDFSTIDWANGPFFIKTETDINGGSNYTITGTSQFLSVPYALHAKTADSVTGTITETDPIFSASVASGITGTDTTNWNNKQDQLVAGSNITIVGNTISATGGGSSNDFYLGQDTLGGIVFYIYMGSDGNQHGLIVSKNESEGGWQSNGTATNATRCWDGVYNTGLMTGSPLATYVNLLTDGGFTDWYLPSIDELSILWRNRFHVNNALNAGGFKLLSKAAPYWSSTEFSAISAFYCGFSNGLPANYSKANACSVRAIRAF
ncbi:MAG: DUF1566 domain-containing protein [Paludibacteraceae bacterium]|nr:DUF1566 domain-containing protein [Paludibacteraceae bacterium]